MSWNSRAFWRWGSAVALGLLACLASAPAGAAEAAAPSEERWFKVEIGGKQAGYYHEMERFEGGRHSVTQNLEIELERGNTRLGFHLLVEVSESADGRLLTMGLEQALGGEPDQVLWTFGPERVEVEANQSGQKTHETAPLPSGEWLSVPASDRKVREAVRKGSEALRFRQLNPSTGLNPVEMEFRRVGPGPELATPNGPRPTTLWRERTGGIESTVYFDADGQALKTETSLSGLAMVISIADEAAARAKREAPELLVSSFVRPSRPLADPRSLHRAVYRLRDKTDSITSLPTSGGQYAERDGDGWRVRVTTERSEPAPAEEDPAPYLRASVYLDFQNPKVTALLAKALPAAKSSEAERAEALRAFVHRYIEGYSLDTGFATASEVAEKRHGDCTENAVLLAALLRAAGIPSRVVTGLLYVEEFAGQKDVFGHHMWTQGLLGARWVDLDSITENRFDAAHIALTTSPLNEPQGLSSPEAMASIAGAEFEIEVISAEK
ncbi:MAG: transglutaminase-like domain-containing protein [Thermoanaerobaculia bacterium]